MKMKELKVMVIALIMLVGMASSAVAAAPVKIKVFVGAQFEIGKLSGDKAGEFQHWYEGYLKDSTEYTVVGAERPVWVNKDGVAGSVLGMGKVRSSSSMTAILANPQFDFSDTYFIITGCGGTPPSVGTVASVFWADYLVDYDLGHRWGAGEVPEGQPLFSLRKGYEAVRTITINPELVKRAFELTKDTPLKDSEMSQKYRQKYPQKTAQRTPFVGVGTHVASDTFFHGPTLSKEAQYVCDVNNAGTYIITEMEGVAVGYVIKKFGHGDRVLSLRTAVNFDQGNPNETTLEHLDPAPGNYPGGFSTGIRNTYDVGSVFVNEVVSHWSEWKDGVPAK
ncbi:purine nucleoside permease [Pseudodesulfovibrio sp. JC047]|uniref:purine-nucleoside phosphorylase n=1 Tax=Pseudodesulfovibrio sp. JC047 TaxID=2683199 RepID=UPI0013CFF00A|nr:purine nucleoside permease [Pseudodesulfovibrio sp. JC047]NDV19960.1 purine nucleoside permease [Pseudodesulfovibrio sp. JC047]